MMPMAMRPRRLWLPWFLFRLTLAAAGMLILVVVLTPVLDTADPEPHGWQSAVALFARDVAVRRTAIASAIGLAVTACIFFRSGSLARSLWRKSSRRPPAPPTNVVGA